MTSKCSICRLCYSAPIRQSRPLTARGRSGRFKAPSGTARSVRVWSVSPVARRKAATGVSLVDGDGRFWKWCGQKQQMGPWNPRVSNYMESFRSTGPSVVGVEIQAGSMFLAEEFPSSAPTTEGLFASR